MELHCLQNEVVSLKKSSPIILLLGVIQYISKSKKRFYLLQKHEQLLKYILDKRREKNREKWKYATFEVFLESSIKKMS